MTQTVIALVNSYCSDVGQVIVVSSVLKIEREELGNKQLSLITSTVWQVSLTIIVLYGCKDFNNKMNTYRVEWSDLLN